MNDLQRIFLKISDYISIIIRKLTEKNESISKSIEFIYKFFILTLDKFLSESNSKIKSDIEIEKKDFNEEKIKLKEIINKLEQKIILQKEEFQKEHEIYLQKFKEKNDLSMFLNKELEDLQKKLEDAKNIGNANTCFDNLINEVNNMNVCLNKMDENNVIFIKFKKFIFFL